MKKKSVQIALKPAELEILISHLRSSLQCNTPGVNHDADSAKAIRNWRAHRGRYVAENTAAARGHPLMGDKAHYQEGRRVFDREAALLERLAAA